MEHRNEETPSQSLESHRQPRQDHHQVEVHKKAGTPEIELLIQAVTVLVKTGPTPTSILFRSGEVREVPLDGNKVRYTCILDPDNPLSVSGIDVSTLDGQNSIE